MANNNAIYNAVLAGAGGAFQQRWISSASASAYTQFRTDVNGVAAAVDSLIAATTITGEQAKLMQSIAQGVFSGRYPQGASSWSSIAQAIVALYTSLSASLLPVDGGGEPSGPAGGDLLGSYPDPMVVAMTTLGGLGDQVFFDNIEPNQALYRTDDNRILGYVPVNLPAGQLGGTNGDPLVIGITTNEDEELTIGEINEGQALARESGSVVGVQYLVMASLTGTEETIPIEGSTLIDLGLLNPSGQLSSPAVAQFAFDVGDAVTNSGLLVTGARVASDGHGYAKVSNPTGDTVLLPAVQYTFIYRRRVT